MTNDDIEEEEKLKTPSKKKQLSSKSHVTPENRPEPKQEVEEKKVYRCGVCPFKYDSQDALVAHVENKHKTSKYCQFSHSLVSEQIPSKFTVRPGNFPKMKA